MKNKLKTPRIVVIDHLSAGPPKKRGLFNTTITCDYDSPEGTVREYFRKGMRTPEYKLRKPGIKNLIKPREEVKVLFSFTDIMDLEEYYHDMQGIGDL